MATRVIQSSGRRAGLPGKKGQLYTVNKTGGMLFDDSPSGLVVYRSATQSIAASTWVPVTFDTQYQMDNQSKAMWVNTAPTVVTILQTDWYFLSATIQCAPLSGSGAGDQWVRFRFNLSTGVTLPGDQTLYPNQYSFPLSCGIVWALAAGVTVKLEVSHTYGSSMTLYGGLNQAVMKIGRLAAIS
jgi:hypothetical protein